MDLLALPIGSIIVACCMTPPPPVGWRDITGSFECIEQIAHFKATVPSAGEFEGNYPLFCIKKVTEEGTS